MEDVAEERIERDAVLMRAGMNRNRRQITDKYWVFLFIGAIVIFRFNTLSVIHKKPDSKNHFGNSTTVNDTSTLIVQNERDGNINSVNGTILNTTSLNITHMWKMIASDLHFLDGNYDNSNSIVMLANILFCSCLIIYFITTMRVDDTYTDHLYSYIPLTFSFNFIFHVVLMPTVKLTSLKFSLLAWCLPELILILLWDKRLPSSNKSDDNEENQNQNARDRHLCCMSYTFVFGLVTPLLCAFIAGTKYKFVSNDHSSSLILILAVYYFIVTINYFMIMALSCACSLSAERGLLHYRDFFQGLFIVARYHFGTACYHATLIFPKIHIIFVSNEKEFRDNPKISTIRRFYLAHWKLPNLSPTLTAVRGHNHSESVRELLRIFINDSPKTKDLQIGHQILRRNLLLLMAINSLVMMSFWAHGATIDPSLSLATWTTYLGSFCCMYYYVGLMDVGSDAMWFHYNQDILLES